MKYELTTASQCTQSPRLGAQPLVMYLQSTQSTYLSHGLHHKFVETHLRFTVDEQKDMLAPQCT